MKLPKKCKVEKMVGRDHTIPVLLHPYLRIRDGKGFLYASDQFNVIEIPVEVTEQDTEGPVHIEAIKASRKLGEEIRCEPGYCIVPGGVAYPREDIQYPALERLFQDSQGTTLHLDTKALHDMAQSLGVRVLTLRIRGDGILGVEPHYSEPGIEGSRGVAMPYRGDR